MKVHELDDRTLREAAERGREVLQEREQRRRRAEQEREQRQQEREKESWIRSLDRERLDRLARDPRRAGNPGKIWNEINPPWDLGFTKSEAVEMAQIEAQRRERQASDRRIRAHQTKRTSFLRRKIELPLLGVEVPLWVLIVAALAGAWWWSK